MDTLLHHKIHCDQLISEFAAAKEQGSAVSLKKSTSNLFRTRNLAGTARMDVRKFNRVLHIDRSRMTADVQGMTTYEEFVRETLKYGLLPAVVPQLKTITVGGAVSGLGIESSSFRFGLVHESVEEMEILAGTGRLVRCSRGENTDLFYGFPNSYGTLGYALRLTMKLVPAGPYVRLIHERFSNAETYFARIAGICQAAQVDFLDGTVFSADDMYLTKGEFTDSAAHVSDYTYMNIYYQSIRNKTEDWLTAEDYIWRWDTDWFWCSKHFHVQHPIPRFMATKWLLNSRTYQRLMRFSQKVMPDSKGTEAVIQDIDIPIESAADFLHFLLREIGITPVWICPFRTFTDSAAFDLYPLTARKVYINFGVWDTVPSPQDGYLNRKIEAMASALEGKKALYSRAYYDKKTFWSIFNKPRYQALKSKYDSDGVFKDLYAKCVGGE